VIQSPNYPGHYNNHEYRQYEITVASLCKIVLTFNEFDVENHYYCGYDYLKASKVCSLIYLSSVVDFLWHL